jgi:hypothetical protein
MRTFLRRWRRRYPQPVAWVDDRANKAARRSEAAWLEQFEGRDSLKRREVRALVDWRLQGLATEQQLALRGLADWGHARRCVKRALEATSPTDALDRLLGECGGIAGWRPAMASAVLAACRPDRYAVVDDRALRALAGLGVLVPASPDRVDRGDWWPYLRACRDLSRVSGLSLRSVAQALCAAAEEAPRLPVSEKPVRRPRGAHQR